MAGDVLGCAGVVREAEGEGGVVAEAVGSRVGVEVGELGWAGDEVVSVSVGVVGVGSGVAVGDGLEPDGSSVDVWSSGGAVEGSGVDSSHSVPSSLSPSETLTALGASV